MLDANEAFPTLEAGEISAIEALGTRRSVGQGDYLYRQGDVSYDFIGADALHRRPLPLETSHPGMFAVGDLRSGSIKRVARAVGEGSASVRSVHEHLAFSR